MGKLITLLLLTFIVSISLFANDNAIHCVKRLPTNKNYPFETVNFNGKMYFRTYYNNKQCVMVTEGDSASTKIVYDKLMISDLDLIYFQVFQDKLYFSSLQNRSPCFITIDKAENVDSIMLQGIPKYTTVLNDILVFSLGFPYFHNGYYLYSPENIYELDINKPNHVTLIDSVNNPFPGYSLDRFFTDNNKLFFTGIKQGNNNMLQFFCSSGLGTKTIQLTQIPSTSCSNSYLNFFEKLNGKIYFESINDNNGIKLFETDGTTFNTKCVADIYNGISCNPNGSLSAAVYGFTSYKKEIYFFGRDTLKGFQLWKTNGDSVGTYLVKQINFTKNLSTQFSKFNKLMYVLGDKLFFTNDQEDTIHGNELYVFNGVNFEYFDLLPRKFGASPFNFFEHHKHLYFIGDDSINKSCLWITDGTKLGTKILYNGKLSGIYSQFNNSLPTDKSFISYKGSLYFEAYYDGLGFGLYRLEDTTIAPDVNSAVFQDDFLCYPNPTKDVINVTFTSKKSEKCELKMIDILGKVYYAESFVCDASSNFKQINLSKYVNGNYLITLETETIKLQSKIEIVH
jgi:ELWxxDGT repeat protein